MSGAGFKNTVTATIAAVRAHGIKRVFWQYLTLDQAKYGKHVGTDQFGNEYYHNPEDLFGRDRWVLYHKWNYDGSQVPAEWNQWLTHTTDDLPGALPKALYQAEHVENVTGTRAAFKTYSTTKPKIDAWEPAVKDRS
ncbi:NADH ubiquinone oxidoreductase subunit NDUFA12-domain-containing protein [Cladochytrium replicatum]|nr:NADH ubiquinone oxidoreductase subunit NDUFA12-domain-containing protein [Cladochytrium replicatum]